MAFQNTAGTIIIDAVLTDLGRRRMAQGNFKIEKFALGDGEVDYSLGGISGSSGDGFYYLFGDENGPFRTKTKTPVLEAMTTQQTTIISSLTDLPREDILYLPKYKINNKIENSTSTRGGVIYISANDETTRKLKSHININTELLQDNEFYDNMLVLESGIDMGTLLGTKFNRDRMIYNLGLFDNYVFVHCNGNFIDNFLTNNPNAHFKNDTADNMYENLSPLSEQSKTNLKGYGTDYDTYYCAAVQNNLTDDISSGATAKSMFEGPRSSALALNFKINKKLTSKSNGTADRRYELFGDTAQTLFGGSETYDFIDTPVVVEGIASTARFEFILRIIRYAG